jgi:hypothetical protein
MVEHDSVDHGLAGRCVTSVYSGVNFRPRDVGLRSNDVRTSTR